MYQCRTETPALSEHREQLRRQTASARKNYDRRWERKICAVADLLTAKEALRAIIRTTSDPATKRLAQKAIDTIYARPQDNQEAH